MSALLAWLWRALAWFAGRRAQEMDDHEAAVEADRAALQSRSKTDDQVVRAGDGAVRNELRGWAGHDS